MKTRCEGGRIFEDGLAALAVSPNASAFSLSMEEILACVQAIGLTWFATSWTVCYHLQPCKALGSRFFKERSEQFFAAAQR